MWGRSHYKATQIEFAVELIFEAENLAQQCELVMGEVVNVWIHQVFKSANTIWPSIKMLLQMFARR